jgi:DNA-binding Lrp family transcriptional regulator
LVSITTKHADFSSKKAIKLHDSRNRWDQGNFEVLMEDARKPILQIANKIDHFRAAIHQRLRKLEVSGVISGSKFVVNHKVLGYNTMVFVEFT